MNIVISATIAICLISVPAYAQDAQEWSVYPSWVGDAICSLGEVDDLYSDSSGHLLATTIQVNSNYHIALLNVAKRTCHVLVSTPSVIPGQNLVFDKSGKDLWFGVIECSPIGEYRQSVWSANITTGLATRRVNISDDSLFVSVVDANDQGAVLSLAGRLQLLSNSGVLLKEVSPVRDIPRRGSCVGRAGIIVSGTSEDGQVGLWRVSLTEGDAIAQVIAGNIHSYAISLAGDGSTILAIGTTMEDVVRYGVVTNESKAVCVDAQTGEVLSALRLHGDRSQMRLDRDGKYILCPLPSGHCEIVCVDDSEDRIVVPEMHGSLVRGVAPSFEKDRAWHILTERGLYEVSVDGFHCLWAYSKQ